MNVELNNIYNEDCIEFMNRVQPGSVDAVITSPPYNTMASGRDDVGYDEYKDDKSDEEYINWTIDIFNGFGNILKKDGVVLYNMSYGATVPHLMNLVIADVIRNTEFTLVDTLIWKKDSAVPNNVSHNRLTRIFEFVYVFVKKGSEKTFKTNKKMLYKNSKGQAIYENIFNYIQAKNNDGSNELNKATYSTEFVDKLMDIYIQDDSLIFDPFMGTGTTAVSAQRKKCCYLGTEISKAQVEYARDRLKTATGEVGLFDTIEQKEMCFD